MRSGRELPTLWRPLPLLGLWIACGVVLSHYTGRVRDWYDMTDEMRYERLAISIARTHSLVPRIHGVDVQSFSQLYPLLLAPIFAHGDVPGDLVSAHVFNAWLMSSTCVPVYLLARQLTRSRRWSLLAAGLAICVPWIVYSTMLMTEVAAYPAAAWTVLALYRATARPSALNDLLALGGLALAFFARTELLVLVLVAPCAIVCYELGATGAQRLGPRLARALRAAVGRHRLLAAAYAALAVAAVVLEFDGGLAGVVGIYGNYAQQTTLFPPGLAGSFAAHVALFALGLGILPVLVGTAWMLAHVLDRRAGAEQRAFACVAVFTLLAVLFQATNFDVRYTGYVHDRFLVYLAPLVLIGTVCALQGRWRPRWSLALPVVVTALGFATGAFPAFTWQQFPQLTPDSPVSGLIRRLVEATGSLGWFRVALVAATVAVAAGYLACARLLAGRGLAVLVSGLTLAALVATTGLTFAQLFGTQGESSRPLTASEAAQAWIDQDPAVGTDGRVTIVPYLVSSDWFVSERVWLDTEFWNKSVVRDALEADDDEGDAFAYSGIWFPKLELSFNPQTGVADASPSPWAVASDKDTRFELAGQPVETNGDLVLLRPDEPWRAAWISFGLYDDGWTEPGVTARIRVFPFPGQRGARLRIFAFAVRAPGPSQRVSIVSDAARWDEAVGEVTVTGAIPVCVPARGYAQIRISTPVSSAIPGDEASLSQSLLPRRGGVFFGETALSTKVGGGCGV